MRSVTDHWSADPLRRIQPFRLVEPHASSTLNGRQVATAIKWSHSGRCFRRQIAFGFLEKIADGRVRSHTAVPGTLRERSMVDPKLWRVDRRRSLRSILPRVAIAHTGPVTMGSMVSVRFALPENRPIFAEPSRFMEPARLKGGFKWHRQSVHLSLWIVARGRA